MRTKKFTKKELIKLLVKKASGFFYNEEQLEYEKKNNLGNKDQKNIKLNNFEKNNEKRVTVSGNSLIGGVNIEVSNDSNGNELCENDLVLTKKKISTHYIPPDMIAIKILFEIFDKKVDGNDIDKLNDEELLNLKNKLLKELKDEII